MNPDAANTAPPEVLILHGPNLNLLGTRQPEVYGATTQAQLLAQLQAANPALNLQLRQTNHEGQLIDWLQAAAAPTLGIVLNAGALSHSSYALYDALLACPLPVVEVHLSHLARRAEAFRHRSVISPACAGVIYGLGPLGYQLAVQAVLSLAKV